jgi:hypothetical protein
MDEAFLEMKVIRDKFVVRSSWPLMLNQRRTVNYEL